MTIVPVQDTPRLHTTPLARVRIEDAQVMVEVDNVEEKRFRLVFRPYQAVRMLTADCYVPPEGVDLVPNRIMEVLRSRWIDELKRNLKSGDTSATFMERARHYIVPLQDSFLEVVAWSVAVSDAIE